MKRRAVRLITRHLMDEAVPDWTLNVVCRTLIDEDLENWQAFLIVTADPSGEDAAIWCPTDGVQHVIATRFRKANRPYYVVPVDNILDGELHDQLLEFLWSPADFDREFPAPVETTARQS